MNKYTGREKKGEKKDSEQKMGNEEKKTNKSTFRRPVRTSTNAKPGGCRAIHTSEMGPNLLNSCLTSSAASNMYVIQEFKKQYNINK